MAAWLERQIGCIAVDLFFTGQVDSYAYPVPLRERGLGGAKWAGPSGQHGPAFPLAIDGQHVSFAVYSRTLIASYRFQRSVLAWECTLCGKLFCPTADEAVERVCLNSPPAHIEQEFRLHSCALVLFAKQEKHEAECFEFPAKWHKT